MTHYWGRVYLYCYPMQPCLIGPLDCVNKAEAALRSTMRRLWGEHTAWTRATVSSLVYALPDADVVVARLLRTATDMGGALRPFYGDEVARRYGQLLTEHITLAGDLVNATLVGNVEKAETIEENWYRNGTEIALFLGSITPYLLAVEFQEIFDEHLMLIKQGMMTMLDKDFKASVDLFDLMEIEALEMADMLSDAVIKQFPYKFMSVYG
ncbi:acetylglutamate kinase [Sporosarcina sp. YIM B06819]|uniref:acetylglutamate kinase n=1 Tax=Sporosarcina sp. YIM B06819 TaxID=3081769 RepID=UPI00298C8A1D|nr:acetylglutamate kinase [Sporosarcina sp. YIM B06819]